MKTGKVSLTRENQLAIQKGALLVKNGWEIEHMLEKEASKPYPDARVLTTKLALRNRIEEVTMKIDKAEKQKKNLMSS